jgi:hypothetical protein
VWIETGRALGHRFSNHSRGRTLNDELDNRRRSLQHKVAQVCVFYELEFSEDLQRACKVSGDRLREIQRWTDQVRESRNVLHWGAVPSVPNTYEKTAILLMDAVSELSDLRRIWQEASRGVAQT